MQCEKFETLWNEALDERRAPEDDAQLMAHAAGCRKCAELLTLADALFIGVEARPALELPADFSQRVMKEFNRPVSPFSRPAVVFSLLALAAAIAVVVGLSWQAQPLGPVEGIPGDAPEVAVESPSAKPAEPFESPVHKITPVVDSLPGLNDDYLAVLRHTGTAVALFPGQVRRVTLSEEPGIVADRIRPVAQPMTAALNALRNALPGSASEMPESPGMPDDAKSSSNSTSPEATNGLLGWS